MTTDWQARARALDTETSFVVQAPAGSGKTTLLIKRYLKLLTQVDEPEEILAITFTRKAATKLRNDIITALEKAHLECPTEPHTQELWKLANQALQRDRACDWQILHQSNRLHIHTIDAFCARLVRMLPFATLSGGALIPTDDPVSLYHEAARNTLLDIEQSTDWSEQVAKLLLYLDNNFERVERLLADMLGMRDQWLQLVVNHHDNETRQLLEASLNKLITEALQKVVAADTDSIIGELQSLAQFAAAQLQLHDKPPQPWSIFSDHSNKLRLDCADLAYWQALAELVFVKDKVCTLRNPKGIRIDQGFPAKTREKDQFIALLGKLQAQPTLLKALEAIRFLPIPKYPDSDWKLLSDLAQLLKVAVAHLKLVFSERGITDYIEIAERALIALGDEETPTDLALVLEYKLRHILVDEFQDTSHNQYELLKRLTAGWQPGDGHTLFCVGDPMQSIYRFRKADVGLYLSAVTHGIGKLKLESLRLTANFRSNKSIIHWVNQTFAQLFPARSDNAHGAVKYSKSDQVETTSDTGLVQIHAGCAEDWYQEADKIIALVKHTLNAHPDENIAILVRARSHLTEILPALRTAGISFRVTEGEALSELPVVQDLFMLTRALQHPGDRLAWFSLLRAPWCGLTLADLSQIAANIPQGALWPALAHVNRHLTPDGGMRLQRITNTLCQQLTLRGRQRLRPWLESTWLGLGGRSVLTSTYELAAARCYFDLIESLDSAGVIDDLEKLAEALNKLYAPPDPNADGRLQIMTMHKAKGLEFDTVILSGLGRITQSKQKELLQYLQITTTDGAEHLLLTPIEQSGGSTKATISHFIRKIDTLRDHYENQRLLYVATTRAKRRLHLLASPKEHAETGEFRPAQRSLLAILWPMLRDNFSPSPQLKENLDQTIWQPPDMYRLPLDWQPEPDSPRLPPQPLKPEQFTHEHKQPVFLWAGETARHIGTTVHNLLERIATEGIDQWDTHRLDRVSSLVEARLKSLGIQTNVLAEAAKTVLLALNNVLNDKRGRWILSSHPGARSEFAITLREPQGLRHLIIDRLFYDEHGERWIIDYKSGQHTGGNIENFLDREADRYRTQMHDYWQALKRLDGRPSRLALYFPLSSGWREISPPDQ